MKFKSPALFAVLLLLGLGGVAWFFLRSQGVASPAALLKPQPVPFRSSFDVKPNYSQSYSLDFKASDVPSRVTGEWTSRRPPGAGGLDDTLVAFKLKGPNNENLQTLDHPTGGTFSFSVKTPGTYTFVFDNSGVIRMTPRHIEISGQRQGE